MRNGAINAWDANLAKAPQTGTGIRRVVISSSLTLRLHRRLSWGPTVAVKLFDYQIKAIKFLQAIDYTSMDSRKRYNVDFKNLTTADCLDSHPFGLTTKSRHRRYVVNQIQDILGLDDDWRMDADVLEPKDSDHLIIENEDRYYFTSKAQLMQVYMCLHGTDSNQQMDD